MEKELFENGKRRKKAPRYYGLRIYLVSTMLYFFLVMPIVGLLLMKYGPDLFHVTIGQQVEIANDSIQQQGGLNQLTNSELPIVGDSIKLITDHVLLSDQNPSTQNEFGINARRTSSENKITDTLYILIRLLILGFIAGLAFNIPFKIYFNKKRKDKIIQPKLFNYCKKHLIKSPLYNSIILMLPFAITLGYMIFILFFNNNFDEITKRLYIQFLFISILATVLTIVFLFHWQRHRVQLKYLEFIYTHEELRKRVYKVSLGKIKNRLWVSSAMTTLLPLIIVIFYLSLSITSLSDLGIESFSEPQKEILYGRYLEWGGGNPDGPDALGLFYINAYDSLFMFFGIFTGIFTSLIYIIIFIRWTTQDVVGPVKELLKNMELTGQGELDQFSIVRTNDEIGELAQGFNEMSQKITDYILNISRINQANSRFVPRQFLDFLGKDSIADINLGDQVQKEMTILFSDIRSFTSISENMTPKENFDFINNYLGYMEPVIRINKGFIDKFMGDSIMALFSEDAEDAINSAIEMRMKLTEFNQVMNQFGKEPIDSGIGIHTGNLMLGIVGGEGRMDGTVISDAVNLAARLEGLTKLYGSSIIISEDTLIKLSDPSQYNYRFIDIVKVKGKREAVYIFEILDGEPQKCKELKIKTKAEFGRALQLYKNKEFENARPLFESIYQINEADQASKLYMERCTVFIENGVPDNWDGIEVIKNK